MRLFFAFILVFISFAIKAQYMGEPENHIQYVQTRLIVEDFVHIEYDTSQFMEVGVGFSTYNYFHTVYNYFDYQKYPDSLSRLFLIKNTRVINAKLYVHGGEYYIDSDWWPTKKESKDFLRIFMTQYLIEQKLYTPIPMMQGLKLLLNLKFISMKIYLLKRLGFSPSYDYENYTIWTKKVLGFQLYSKTSVYKELYIGQSFFKFLFPDFLE